METLHLDIDGMSCSHCVGSVQNALSAVDGVDVTSVTIGHADVAYDAAKADRSAILAAVGDAGYEARVAEPAS